MYTPLSVIIHIPEVIFAQKNTTFIASRTCSGYVWTIMHFYFTTTTDCCRCVTKHCTHLLGFRVGLIFKIVPSQVMVNRAENTCNSRKLFLKIFKNFYNFLSIHRSMLHRMLLYRRSDSWGIWPRDIPLSTRFRSQNKFWRSKMDNQCQNWSKIIEIGPKIGLCRVKYFNPKSWIFLKKS